MKCAYCRKGRPRVWFKGLGFCDVVCVNAWTTNKLRENA